MWRELRITVLIQNMRPSYFIIIIIIIIIII